MKGNKTQYIPCGGVDTQIITPSSSASAIFNMRWDNKLGCWRSDMGFKPWWHPPSAITYSGSGTNYEVFNKYAEAIYFWEKPNSGETYHFAAMNDGSLYAVMGNKGNGTANITDTTYLKDWFLIGNISTRKKQNAGVQFIPFGRKLLIIDGVSEMIWFEGIDRSRNFSFHFPTPRLDVLSIQPDYQQGQPLEGYGTGAPQFTDNQVFGLGDTAGDPNYYEYAFAYVTEDGALSPISGRSSVSWQVDQTPAADEYKYGVSITLPECPKGCVARYIYRTKNIKTDLSSGASHQLFFLKEIRENSSTFYIDYFEDGNLTQQAETFSSIQINASWRYGDNWNGRLWLANEDRIIYSEIGIPEQFGAANYFDLGNTIGGKITGLKSFYNNLLVFRENAINIITLDGNGGYGISILSSSIGTRATNAIAVSPEVGVIFPNEDGIWAVAGTNQGGDTLRINKLSGPIDDEWKTANKTAQEAMIGEYSIKEREYWLHYPAYFNTKPTQGLVLHTNKEQNTWSFRKPINAINEKLWWFSAMTTDKEGNFVFASVPSWTNGFSAGSVSQLMAHFHVWCPSSTHSVTGTVSGVDAEQNPSFSVADVNRLNGKWVSSWIDFPEGATRIYSVEVELIALGDNNLKLRFQTDYESNIQEVSGVKMTETKVVYTTKEPPVGVASTDPNPAASTKAVFNVGGGGAVGTDGIVSNRKVRVRFDVNTSLSNQFKFELEGDANAPITLVAYKLNLRNEAVPRLNQNTRMQKGQSR
jgi:hypothetical protein